jgi:hypothetical protein
VDRRTTSLKIIGAMVLVAIAFGVLHDLFSAAVCTEYFTDAHPKIIESRHWLAMALLWGVIATWWAGLFGGLWLSICTQVGSAEAVELRLIVRAALIGAAIILVPAPVTWLWAYRREGGGGEIDLGPRLEASLAMHTQSYFLAAVVFFAIGVAFVVKRYRKNPSSPC